MNSLDIADAHKDGKILNTTIQSFSVNMKKKKQFFLADHNECTQLLQITQNCLELGGSAGDLMLPVCTLYRVCSTCVSKMHRQLKINFQLMMMIYFKCQESEQSECEAKFIQGSHELCSKAPLCRYFSRRILQLMQEHPLQMQCHKCMVNFLQNED